MKYINTVKQRTIGNKKVLTIYHSLCVNKPIILQENTMSSFLILHNLKEFNHTLITIIIFASLKILHHYEYLTLSKSMQQKSNHIFKEKYYYVHAGTLEPMHVLT